MAGRGVNDRNVLKCVVRKNGVNKLTTVFSAHGIAELHPQSLRQFAYQPSVRVSQNLRPSHLSHMIAAAT
jgi:hypothetical protein